MKTFFFAFSTNCQKMFLKTKKKTYLKEKIFFLIIYDK